MNASDDFSGINQILFSFNNVSWMKYDDPIVLTEDGIFTMYYFAIDNAGNKENINVQVIKIDLTAPSTTLTFTNYYVDDNDQIFITAQSLLTLNSFDLASGIENIFYRINGSNWMLYNKSFNRSGLNGFYLIDYYSIDLAGNAEGIKSQIVYLSNLIIDSYISHGCGKEISYFGF